MGIYIFISDSDRQRMSVVEDEEVNDLLKEARAHEPLLLVEQKEKVITKWFNRIIEPRFSVYHESPAFDGTTYQARLNIYGSGSKVVTIAYLTGIINGALAKKNIVTK